MLFPKTENKGTLPNSFCEANITLMPKADEDTTRKKKKKLNEISLMNIDAKNPQ